MRQIQPLTNKYTLRLNEVVNIVTQIFHMTCDVCITWCLTAATSSPASSTLSTHHWLSHHYNKPALPTFRTSKHWHVYFAFLHCCVPLYSLHIPPEQYLHGLQHNAGRCLHSVARLFEGLVRCISYTTVQYLLRTRFAYTQKIITSDQNVK